MITGKVIDKASSANDNIDIDQSRCMRMRFNKSPCRKCMECCRAKAIAVDGCLSIDKDKCSECMLCVSECPSDAYKISRFDFYSIINGLKSITSPVMSCNLKSGLSAHVRMRCLGFLSEEHIIALLAFVLTPVQINLTECENCKNGFIVNVLKERLQSVGIKTSIKAKVSEKILLVESGADLNYQEVAYDRRSFFRRFKKQIFMGATEFFEYPDSKEGGQIYSNKMVPFTRALLNSAISVLQEDVKSEILKNYYYDLFLDESCNQCFACVGMCPAGALKIDRRVSAERLLFNPSLCSGCGLCAGFCMNNSMRLEQGFHGVAPAEFINVDRQSHNFLYLN